MNFKINYIHLPKEIQFDHTHKSLNLYQLFTHEEPNLFDYARKMIICQAITNIILYNYAQLFNNSRRCMYLTNLNSSYYRNLFSGNKILSELFRTWLFKNRQKNISLKSNQYIVNKNNLKNKINNKMLTYFESLFSYGSLL